LAKESLERSRTLVSDCKGLIKKGSVVANKKKY